MKKKSEKTICLMMLLFLVVFATFQSMHFASSQLTATVKVNSQTDFPQIGQAFTVTINLANVQNLYGLEIILNWNAAVLQVTNIELRLGVESFSDGVLHESSNSPPLFIGENKLTQSSGEYSLVATSTAPAPSFTGGGNIVKLTFSPITLGNSNLSLQSQLYDYPPTDREPRISQPIEHTDQNAFVTVIAATSTTAPTNGPTTSANVPSDSPATSTGAPSSSPVTSTTVPSIAPTESGTSPTSTSAVPSTLPSSSQTPSSWQLNLGLEFVLPTAVIVLVGIVVLAFLVRARRKRNLLNV